MILLYLKGLILAVLFGAWADMTGSPHSWPSELCFGLVLGVLLRFGQRFGAWMAGKPGELW